MKRLKYMRKLKKKLFQEFYQKELKANRKYKNEKLSKKCYKKMFRPEEHISSDWKTSLCAMDKWIKKILRPIRKSKTVKKKRKS